MSVAFSFKLSEDFVSSFRTKQAPFGYRDAAGNSVGEITFLRTYSRKKEDGTKETWVDVCERVINGMYSIQKDHCKTNRLPWSDTRAAASAKEAFDRLFNLKWTPPGRGLWVMGTNIVNVQRNSAALQNCAHCSWSHSEPKLLSFSSVRSFMCLSAFPCTSISCNSSRMHALCAAVTTSFCPRHPALWIWPIVSFGSTPFQLPPFSSCAFLHNMHSALSL